MFLNLVVARDQSIIQHCLPGAVEKDFCILELYQHQYGRIIDREKNRNYLPEYSEQRVYQARLDRAFINFCES